MMLSLADTMRIQCHVVFIKLPLWANSIHYSWDFNAWRVYIFVNEVMGQRNRTAFICHLQLKSSLHSKSSLSVRCGQTERNNDHFRTNISKLQSEWNCNRNLSVEIKLANMNSTSSSLSVCVCVFLFMAINLEFSLLFAFIVHWKHVEACIMS